MCVILTNLEHYMAMTYLQQNSLGTCCKHNPPRLLSRSMKSGSGVWESVQNLDFNSLLGGILIYPEFESPRLGDLHPHEVLPWAALSTLLYTEGHMILMGECYVWGSRQNLPKHPFYQKRFKKTSDLTIFLSLRQNLGYDRCTGVVAHGAHNWRFLSRVLTRTVYTLCSEALKTTPG